MSNAKHEILVNWPKKALFNYLCDIENYPEWQESVYSAEWITRERHQPGARFVETRFVNGRKEEVFAEIKENVPLLRRTTAFRNGRLQSLFTFEFESHPAGTLLRWDVKVKAPALLEWTEQFIAERMRTEKQAELEKLKVTLEAEVDHSSEIEEQPTEIKN
jgi:hypothetical protein